MWETIENHSLSLHLTGLFEWRLIDFLIILSSIICKNKIVKMKMKNMCMVQNLQIHTILLLAMTWLPQLKYLKKHPQFKVFDFLILYLFLVLLLIHLFLQIFEKIEHLGFFLLLSFTSKWKNLFQKLRGKKSIKILHFVQFV